MEDLSLLLPHCKKDAKVENAKEERAVMLNEMADLKGCSSSIFFEVRLAGLVKRAEVNG